MPSDTPYPAVSESADVADVLPVRNSVAAFLSRLSEDEVEYFLGTVAGLHPEIFTLYYLRYCQAEGKDPFAPDYLTAAQMVGALLCEMFRETGTREPDAPGAISARLLVRHIEENDAGFLCFCWPVAVGMLSRINVPPETVGDLIGMKEEIAALWVALAARLSESEEEK